MGHLATPDRIQELQRKLHHKAKEEPTFRFYSLYDKTYWMALLEYAYRLVKANGGAPGVDRQTFEDIEAYGEEPFLTELAQELKDKTYQPKAVRRVMIPKADGGERPLGIPTVKDRTVQMAVKLLLEPIFEADFPANAHGYRPGHSALQAVQEVHELLRAGYTDVVDADLSKYFDTIPHDQLLKSVARRIADGAILHLIKMWLTAPIDEEDDHGRPQRRATGNRGTPQGGVISPLLANIYIRRVLLTWTQRHERPLKARIVNYADDMTILCRRTAPQALSALRDILTRIGLTLNEVKTRVCDATQEAFDFLGYTFGRCYDPRTGEAYLGAKPAKKRLGRLRDHLRNLLAPNHPWDSDSDLIGAVNRVLTGWRNYFSYGTVSRAYRAVDAFVQSCVRHALVRRHKISSRGTRQYSAQELDLMGLVNLTKSLAALRTPSV